MKREVGIAELKAHLNEYIRAAQKGKEIVIKDRDTPVARLAPIEEKKLPFRTIPAKRKIHNLNQMSSISWPEKPELIEQALAEARRDRTFGE
jgi:prevent-host-death family protein